MHCTKTRTMSRMLCNFWFGVLGGLIVYSFIFLLDLAWFNWINFFPCIWLPSLPIESHQEWYFLLDHLTILHYFTCTDAVRAANVLSLVGVFFMCACRIYLFSHPSVKAFNWQPCSKKYMEKYTSATGCMERAENQNISHLNLTGQYLSF